MSKGYKSLNTFFSNSSFIKSFLYYEEIHSINLPEICFLGRSNVGKSSLINIIAKNKKLTKTSKIPGKTKSINLYNINEKIVFADLPGYGYAKLSKKLRYQLMNLIEDYMSKRENLKKIFFLIDGKIGIKENDLYILNFIINLKINFSIVLTKIDKSPKKLLDIRKNEINSILSNYKNLLFEIFLTSSKKNTGITEIQKSIFNLTK